MRLLSTSAKIKNVLLRAAEVNHCVKRLRGRLGNGAGSPRRILIADLHLLLTSENSLASAKNAQRRLKSGPKS